ncbi:MAG: response regulator [Chitinispirillaceae bacterium]|nr:response regulator [Chitinispirillaceae bacterium]
MAKSVSQQYSIARVRHLLLELVKTLNRSLPDFSPQKGFAPVKKGSDPDQVLENVVTELGSVRDRVARLQKLSQLRIEMWKAAAGDKTSEEKLIEKLLFLVGPALDLSRCGYFTVLREKSEAVCTIQWFKARQYASPSSRLPYDIVSEFIGQRYVAAYEDVPAGKRQEEIAALLKFYKVKSFLAVPYDDPYSFSGILTFSDCEQVRTWTQTEIDLLIEIAHIVSTRARQIKAEQLLRETNSRLEQQVKARTTELAEANLKLKEDLAEREKVKNALAAEKRLLAVTLRSIGDAVILLNAEGRIALINKAAEIMTGWALEEAAGKKFEIVVQLFDEKHFPVSYKNFIAQCPHASLQRSENRCFLRSRGGNEIIAEYQGAVIREKDGYNGNVMVLRDITQSHFLEEELLKIKKFESVGVLAGGIAHDFNNLLTGITTYLFMAKTNASGNKEVCSMITEAEKAAFKATTLTKQLLSFAKGGSSVRETVSIRQVILDTVGFCLSGSNVDHRIDVPEDLWLAEVDKGQIDQVMSNLIQNAVQAMPGGGTVTIQGENHLRENSDFSSASPKSIPLAPGKYVKITVVDEGVGIPSDQLDRVFDPYFTTKKGGTGLGLTTVYSIIKRHKGNIYAESTPGKGSIFTFFLPASDKPERKKYPDESTMNGGTGRVLIMDDDVIVRTVVESFLKKAGYSPVGVSNGTQTLELYAEALSQNDPFLITILDLTIPGGMGGKETVRKLREIDPDARVIAFSGYSNDPIFADYKRYGFDGVLAKPFSIQEFMRAIGSVMGPRKSGENSSATPDAPV